MARIKTGVSPRLNQMLEELLEGIEDGLVPAWIFNDPELFELEQQKIFSRSWVYMAHESEIPQAGDYVLRYVANNPYIVVRGEDGAVRALLDMCRHRGMRVCRAELGNASHFRCPFHGWTYRNDGRLVGVPAEREAFGPGFDKAEWGLRPIPRLEVFDGMIFGNLDPQAPPLEEWLGEIRWYLELVTKRSPAGLEVLGPPQRWVVNTDWKLALETFLSDSYHTLMT
ncbi:Rieske 2Fe-2S domain-containing protein, partial [Meiothermus taiwanensis]